MRKHQMAARRRCHLFRPLLNIHILSLNGNMSTLTDRGNMNRQCGYQQGITVNRRNQRPVNSNKKHK